MFGVIIPKTHCQNCRSALDPTEGEIWYFHNRKLCWRCFELAEQDDLRRRAREWQNGICPICRRKIDDIHVVAEYFPEVWDAYPPEHGEDRTPLVAHADCETRTRPPRC